MGNWADVVLVERRDPGTWNGYQGDMFEWRLTFSPRDGDVPELQVTIMPYSDQYMANGSKSRRPRARRECP